MKYTHTVIFPNDLTIKKEGNVSSVYNLHVLGIIRKGPYRVWSVYLSFGFAKTEQTGIHYDHPKL